MKLTLRLKGGTGSGHFGHSGRPGKVGGSGPGGSGGGSYMEFTTITDAERYEHMWDEATEDLFSEESKEVLTAYTGAMYQDINGTLRHGTETDRVHVGEREDILYENSLLVTEYDYTTDNMVPKMIGAMDDVMEVSKTPDNITVYRTTPTKFKEDYPVGSMFVDEGFSSTSLLRLSALQSQTAVPENQRSLMRIQVPKGYPAMSAASYSWVDWEKEVILNRNTAFRVTSYETDGLLEIMNVEVLP